MTKGIATTAPFLAFQIVKLSAYGKHITNPMPTNRNAVPKRDKIFSFILPPRPYPGASLPTVTIPLLYHIM